MSWFLISLVYGDPLKASTDPETSGRPTDLANLYELQRQYVRAFEAAGKAVQLEVVQNRCKPHLGLLCRFHQTARIYISFCADIVRNGKGYSQPAGVEREEFLTFAAANTMLFDYDSTLGKRNAKTEVIQRAGQLERYVQNVVTDYLEGEKSEMDRTFSQKDDYDYSRQMNYYYTMYRDRIFEDKDVTKKHLRKEEWWVVC